MRQMLIICRAFLVSARSFLLKCFSITKKNAATGNP